MSLVDEVINSLIVELKRGTMVLLVLSQLHTNEYGYSLVKKLEDKDIQIEAGTLYPLLRRLEKQKLLISEWDTSENRPRKYYTLSEDGKIVFKQIKKEWEKMSKILGEILEEEEK